MIVEVRLLQFALLKTNTEQSEVESLTPVKKDANALVIFKSMHRGNWTFD